MTPSHAALGSITVLGVVAAYISGAWGIYGHFLVRDKIEPEMKLTSALSLGGLLWFLLARWQHGALTASVAPVLDSVALVLLAMFMVLFWWTVSVTRRQRLTLAFSKDQPQFIYTTGPYGLLRHPFYTSYIIFWVAVAIGSGTWLFGLLPLTMFILYWRAIKFEEAKFAASPLSSEYASYKLHTGGGVSGFWSRQKSSGHP